MSGRISLIRDEIKLWARSCVFCGMNWGRIDLLCPSCWTQFLDESELPGEARELFQAPLETFPGRCLAMLDWYDPRVMELIGALKQGQCVQAFERLAQCWSRRYVADLTTELIFVPAPPRSKAASSDHAFEWASALAKVYGGEVFLNLARVDMTEQKKKSRAERSDIEFFTQSPLSERLRGHYFVLVDDVVTTGSTLNAMWTALGKPSLCEAWTLAWAPRRQ